MVDSQIIDEWLKTAAERIRDEIKNILRLHTPENL